MTRIKYVQAFNVEPVKYIVAQLMSWYDNYGSPVSLVSGFKVGYDN